MAKKKKPAADRRTWRFSDHLCRYCGGRIMELAAGGGPSGGGNSSYKCAGCCKVTSGVTCSSLCWCGQGGDDAFMCLPFAVLGQYPELHNAFEACGYHVGRGKEVGVILSRAYSEAIQASSERNNNPERVRGEIKCLHCGGTGKEPFND